jgi:hypothetical protein
LITPGLDVETESNLIARMLARWPATSLGLTYASYRDIISDCFDPSKNGAIPANTVNPCLWVGVSDDNPGGPGTVGLFLAGAAGGLSQQNLDIANTYIQTYCKQVGSGQLTVSACPNQDIQINATLYASNPNVVDIATAALNTLASTFPPGSTVWWAEVLSTLTSIPNVYNVSLASLGSTISLTRSDGSQGVIPGLQPNEVPSVSRILAYYNGTTAVTQSPDAQLHGFAVPRFVSTLTYSYMAPPTTTSA